MHIFWHNGALMLHPDSPEEAEALELLWDNTNRGRPERNDPGKPPTMDDKRNVA